MNEVISQLAERKSVRVYEDREIDEAAVSQIIDTVECIAACVNQP